MKLLTKSPKPKVEEILEGIELRGNPLMEFNYWRFRAPTPVEVFCSIMEDRKPNPPLKLLPLARLDQLIPKYSPGDILVRFRGRIVGAFPRDWVWMVEPMTNRLVLRAPYCNQPSHFFEAGKWDLVK